MLTRKEIKMAKFYGQIGYAIDEEPKPSIHVERIIERNYRGEEVKNTRKLHERGEVNDSITITNQISILSDPFAMNNFHNIRYVTYNGVRWKVENVEVARPRLILSLGGVYNGPTPGFGPDSTTNNR